MGLTSWNRRIGATGLPGQPSLRWVLAAILLCWAWVAVPLALGRETLFLRDVFSIHFPYKAFGAQQLAEGRIPAFMPVWGLGHPFRGNPHVLAFYPGNLLYLVLPFWSAFNLHYVLHWLLAFLAMRALAREFGQSAPAALLAGLAYAGGGIVVSSLSFYNLITVLAWWPLAMLGATRGGRTGIALGGLACGLALLGGEPITAALGTVPLLLAAMQRQGWRRGAVSAIAVGLLGLLVALPQIVATARILPESFRGAVGLDAPNAAAFSLHPLRVVELVLPHPFGLPARGGVEGFWSESVTPRPPFFSSLHFGVIALWLAAWACRRHRAWSQLTVAGLLLAWLGGWSGGALSTLSFGLFRYPEKFLLWLALGGALLAGFGLDSVASADRRRATARSAVGAATLALLLAGATVLARSRWLVDDGTALRELVSVQGAALALALAVCGLLLGATALAVWRNSLAGVVFLELLGLFQLAPLAPRVSTSSLREPPSWIARAAPGTAVHSPLWAEPRWQPQDPMPHSLPAWAAALHPTPGILYGLSYPLGADFEGLGSALSGLLLRNLSGFDWDRRLRWCRAMGVETLVAFRPLDSPLLDLLEARGDGDYRAYLYRLRDPAPVVWWPRKVTSIRSPIAALAAVTRAENPVAEVFVPRQLEQAQDGGVALLRHQPDRIALAVQGGGGVAVVRRAYSRLWRARTDTGSLAVEPVNLGLMGVVVPAGPHRIELEVPVWPETVAGALALATSALLLWSCRRA